MVTLREYSDKISSMWVYEANGDDTPDTVSYGSGKEFTWRCNNNPKHIFKKKVSKMFSKTGEPIGCIYCEAERPLPFPGETDLFSILPIAKKMWDYDKNNGFDTNCIHPGSPNKAWFICENGHSFQRDICRFVKNQNCPDCKELKNVIAKFPHMVKQWHFEKNKGIDINLTSANSSQTVWWKCKKCNYEWQSKISSRHASKGLCPCCEVRIVVQDGVTDLFTLYPELKEEYNFEKNKGIDSSSLSVTTSTPVWWKCNVGHEWQVSPSGRIQIRNRNPHISKCPHCQGIKRLIGYAEEYPELSKSFIADKNGRDFSTITSNDRLTKFWWFCNTCKNEFLSTTQAMIRSYSSFAEGCPYCAGKKVKKENSFAALHPDIIDEYSSENKIDPYNVTEKSDKMVKWVCRNNPEHKWSTSFRQRANGTGNCPECRGWHYNKILWQERPDPEKYYDINKNKRSFKTYSYMSNEKVWWNCDNGHSFETMIMNVTRREQFQCPICENRLVEKGYNDLASQYPDLAQEFDADKNMVHPDDIYYASTLQYWWKCTEGHEFIRSAYHRVARAGECPVCNREIVVKGINDLQNKYPEVVNIWDYEKNSVSPDEISDISTSRFYFKCKLGHTYEAGLNSVKNNSFKCHVCNNIIVQKGINSLVDTHPELAAEFSPNEMRKPSEFNKHMAYSILWRCPHCNGDYHYSIKDRELNDESCPYCYKKRVLPGYNALTDTHPELVKEWSPNNERGPETFTKDVGVYVKWICPKCNGEYAASISSREVADDACPYCKNDKPLLGYNSLADTHPKLAEEWSPNNATKPYEVLKKYTYPVKWVCSNCGGEYTAKINKREIGDDSCPYCNDNKILQGYNSFKAKHDKLLNEWDYINNYLICNPDTVSDNTRKKVWWICQNKHKYLMPISMRVYYQKRNLKACPYCKGLRQKKEYYF